jgi:ADP-ribose pyrophosphatase YjhB (NUDIX family)
MEIGRFTIRVYGLLINEEQEVLLVHEKMPQLHFTKFPGGGLELGEGTRDCLVREFMEETGLAVKVTDHLYTTDFFVSSSFHANSQVISIYYMVKAKSKLNFKISITAHNYDKKEGAQSLRWIDFKELKESDLTLIIDKRVAELLMKKFG